MKFVYFFILLCLFSCSSETGINKATANEDLGNFVDDWTFEFFMISSEKNVFRLWVPENIKPKAILVLAPGNASDGTSLVNRKYWQEYAEKEELAILGIYVRSDMEGSAFRLLKAIEIISEKNNLEGFTNLPFLLRGFSHGGIFSYVFSELYSERVLAFANIKGSFSDVEKKLPPGLFIIGENDKIARNESIKNAFLSQRKKKSISCFIEEPIVGHDVGKSDDLVKVFFETILEKRLINNEIVDLNEEDFYLGDNLSSIVYPYSDYINDKSEASCILDLNFAASWKNFKK